MAVVAALAAGCGGPTAPTPSPGGPPVLTCPGTVAAVAASDAGAFVTFKLPFTTGGREPFAISCTPASGLLFPVGTTTVSCSVTDASAATGACTFPVQVAPVPRLTLTRFMAFGDSITAGEVTVPVANATTPGGAPEYRQIVVPPASYPSVLSEQLRQRYVVQSVTVVNAGRPGDAAATAFPRFQAAMSTNRPEVVLLLMGYNDLENRSTTDAAYQALERMAKDARGRGARGFLGTLTPSIQGRSRSQIESLVLRLNDSIRTLAAGENAVLVDLYRAALPNVEAWIGVDGLHPTEAGYARIAEQFFTAIRIDLEAR